MPHENIRALADADFPVAGVAGRMAYKTDDWRGPHHDTGTQWVKTAAEINVEDFLDGSSDHTQAIIDAAAALQAAGGGRLVIPWGTYRVFSTDYSASLPAVPLIDLNGLDNVEIIMQGAVFNVDRTFSVGESVKGIKLTDCTNVRIMAKAYHTPAHSRSDVTGSSSGKGLSLVECNGACRNVTVDAHMVGGRAMLGAIASAGTTRATRTSGINARLHGTNVGYCFTAQFSGDNANVYIDAEDCRRGYIAYGITGHHIELKEKNSTNGARINAYGGEGCENVYLRIESKDNDEAHGGAFYHATLSFTDTTPAVHRGIHIDLDVESPTSLGGIPRGFRLEKADGAASPDGTTRGHILQDLTVKGTIRNAAAGVQDFDLATSRDGGFSGETISNIRIGPLTADSQVNLNWLEHLVDTCVIERVKTPNRISVVGSGAGGRIVFIGCKASVLHASGGASEGDWVFTYIECEATAALSQNFSNKIFINTKVGSTTYNRVAGRDIGTDGTKLDGIESGATDDQTGAEIKTAYEAEADTNAYTDAEVLKLAGIEDGADVTPQAADVGELTNNTGKGSDNIIEAMPATAGTAQGMLGPEKTAIDNNFSDVATQLNEIRQALRTAELMQ